MCRQRTEEQPPQFPTGAAQQPVSIIAHVEDERLANLIGAGKCLAQTHERFEIGPFHDFVPMAERDAVDILDVPLNARVEVQESKSTAY